VLNPGPHGPDPCVGFKRRAATDCRAVKSELGPLLQARRSDNPEHRLGQKDGREMLGRGSQIEIGQKGPFDQLLKNN